MRRRARWSTTSRYVRADEKVAHASLRTGMTSSPAAVAPSVYSPRLLMGRSVVLALIASIERGFTAQIARSR